MHAFLHTELVWWCLLPLKCNWLDYIEKCGIIKLDPLWAKRVVAQPMHAFLYVLLSAAGALQHLASKLCLPDRIHLEMHVIYIHAAFVWMFWAWRSNWDGDKICMLHACTSQPTHIWLYDWLNFEDYKCYTCIKAFGLTQRIQMLLYPNFRN